MEPKRVGAVVLLGSFLGITPVIAGCDRIRATMLTQPGTTLRMAVLEHDACSLTMTIWRQRPNADDRKVLPVLETGPQVGAIRIDRDTVVYTPGKDAMAEDVFRISDQQGELVTVFINADRGSKARRSPEPMPPV